MNPVISIIVPIHNVELYLRDCIDSILQQTFSNIELILINDGSTDKSGDICNEYAKKDLRVKVIHQKYHGVSAARNVGIIHAKGDYIGFVDSDDRIVPLMYQTLFQLSMDTKSDIAICQLGREINGKLINKVADEFVREMNNEEAMKELFIGNLYRFSLCNKLFNKKCFENIQFPEGRIHEDLSTTYKLFAHANKSVFTNFIGYIYVKRENSILTSTFNEKRLDAFTGWDEILSFMIHHYPQTSSEVVSRFVYWCVDNVHDILSQVQNKGEQQRYLARIQHCVKKYYKDIQERATLTSNYRYLIALLNYNIRLFLLQNSLKKLMNRIKGTASKMENLNR